jgi:hypothetical protein
MFFASQRRGRAWRGGDAFTVDDVLTDDTSIDDDIMGEKIRPKDFVDDADVERGSWR